MQNAFQNERQKDVLIGIAAATLLCSFSVYAPLVGFFCFLVLPVPIIFYRIKSGRKSAGIIILASLFLVMLLTGDLVVDILFLAGIMGLGYLIGEGIEKDFPIEKSIAFSAGLIFLAAICGLVIYGNVSNIGAVKIISDYINKNFELTIAAYKKMGMPKDAIHALSDAQKEIRQTLIRIMPALILAGLLFIGWMNFLLARMLFKRKNIPVLTDMPLNIWKAPDKMVWGMIGSIGLLVLPTPVLNIIGLNGLILFMTIYFFQGIAIISFYLEKKQIPVPFRVLFYSLIVIEQLLALLVVGLGFFDVWINFRKIGINNNNQ